MNQKVKKLFISFLTRKQTATNAIAREHYSEVDKPRNRANCDKSMKIGESTKFDMLNKIGYRPLLKYGPLCYF